jgi:hypothetical protein
VGAKSDETDAEGAESEGENQRGPRQRGRCGGADCFPPPPPPPLSIGRIYRPSFREKSLFFAKTACPAEPKSQLVTM